MLIVMHCGGLPFNGQTIKESSLGGSETAAYYLARELAAAGHTVTLFTNHPDAGVFDGVKYEYAGNITEQTPLGERFTFYAENTPHDICLIQRHLQAFARKWASKLNYWWLHDIAQIRNRDIAVAHLWNVDRILCVSEFHKAQIAEAWGIEKNFITVMSNGVDLNLFAGEIVAPLNTQEGVRNLIYSSRPERGLINLLMPNGIMEKLKDESFHLYICGYENKTPQMAQFYDYLYARAEELPNVTNLGALTKKQLADVMRQCDTLIYPTTFEEVSCITAMEAMAAGLQIISSEWGALSETCAGSAAMLLPLNGDEVDIDAVLEALHKPIAPELKETQRAAAQKFTWARSAGVLMSDARELFKEHGSELSRAFHFMRHSDIIALEKCNLNAAKGVLAEKLLEEFDKGYAFYRNNDYAAHYAAYYEYEKNRGVNYGPEDVTGTTRFQVIANMVSQLPASARVLDYGCAHGHYTVALAKLFPQLEFVGVDLAQSNLDIAANWVANEGLTNIHFIRVDGMKDGRFLQRDANGVAGDLMLDRQPLHLIIAAEVVEHVGNPQELLDALASNLVPAGQLVITVPYGPWEAQGYREHGYWRAHLHHFERQDLAEMLGHHPDYKISAVPGGVSQFCTPLGSYVVSFTKPTAPSRPIDYARKLAETMPDQTLSICMIVKDGGKDIRRSLESALPFVQEVIIGVDEATRDDTRDVLRVLEIENPLVAFKIFDIPPVLVSGFAAARNATIAAASCDWILWLDADEVLVGGENLSPYLRHNHANGYAVKQHHFSMVPMGVIKVDLPCRLFRNRKSIQFFGRVHEHPECKLNEGLGSVMLINGVEIAHYGYTTEMVRRQRFARNINPLKQDREELPERLLGKFLWLRDLAQMSQYEIEAGQANPDELLRRANEGIKIWEELLESGNTRIALDGLEFYSALARFKGDGFDFGFALAADKLRGEAQVAQAPVVKGHFASKEHARRLMEQLLNDKVQHYNSRYY